MYLSPGDNGNRNTTTFTSPLGRHRFALYLLAIAVAFSPILFGDFLFDDYFNLRNAAKSGWSWSGLMRNFVIRSELIHDGWQPPAFQGFVVRYFRPLFLLSLLADRALWGFQAWGYHLTNLLLHLGVVAAFYAVLRELLDDRRSLAAYGALLFGVTHSHVPAVCWLSGRTELLPALGMMIALWGWLRFGRTGAWGLYALSLAAVAVSLFCKENAAIFPFLAFAAWLWLLPRPRVSVWLLVPYALVVAGYLVVRYESLGGFPLPPPSFYYHPPSEPQFVVWALAKVVCVFFNMVFQLPLLFPADRVLMRHPAVLGVLLVLVAAIAVALFRLLRGHRDDEWRRRGYFALAWIALGLAPTAPLLITNLYFYFPAAGMCIVLLALWSRVMERGRPRWLCRPRWRKAVPILAVALSVVAIQPGNALLILGGRTAHRLLAEGAEAVGEVRDGARIYVLDLPLLAYSLKNVLELRYPDRPFELHVLTLSPHLVPGRQATSRVERTDEHTLVTTALGPPYFSGPFGLIALHNTWRGILEKGRIHSVPGYRIEFGENEMYGRQPELCVRRIVFHFDEPLDSPTNVFVRFVDGRFSRVEWDGSHSSP